MIKNTNTKLLKVKSITVKLLHLIICLNLVMNSLYFTLNYKMLKGTYLTELGQSQIVALMSNDIRSKQIAITIDCSKNIVDKFIEKGENYGKNKKTRENAMI